MAKNEEKIEEKITIILANYNNEKYIEESLDSVLEQNYPSIELIITDDGSKIFNVDKVKSYINKHKKDNIKNVEFILNKNNIGTVKTLNKALKSSTGDYILIMASDDKLASNDVLEKYHKVFVNKEINIISSQWVICDYNLNKIKNFVDVIWANKCNKNRLYQEYQMMIANRYGAGSTCYRKEIFDKYGFFDEKYKLLEDWPYWLDLISKGEIIHFVNFDGLLHRSGGVSTNLTPSESVVSFYYDNLNLFKDYIIPKSEKLSYTKRVEIFKSYESTIIYYSQFIDVSEYVKDLNERFAKDFKLRFMWYKNDLKTRVLNNIMNNYILIVATIFSSLVVDFIIINRLDIPKNLLLICYIACYEIFYWLLNIIINIIKAIFRKR